MTDKMKLASTLVKPPSECPDCGCQSFAVIDGSGGESIRCVLCKIVIDLPAYLARMADALDIDAVAALVESAETLRKDMLLRAEVGMDTLCGEEYRVVNAGNGAWHGFCTSLAKFTGDPK